jgi:hypothetical protein
MEASVERKFQFLRNGDGELVDLDWSKGIESARQAISEALNAKNVAFLLGAGCSSFMKGGKELGIATMAPLAKEFCGETLDARAAAPDNERLAQAVAIDEAGTRLFVCAWSRLGERPQPES